MNNLINLSSYDNVEIIQLSLPDNEFRRYCEDKFLSAKNNLQFIENTVFSIDRVKEELIACEIGSGNSKLLYCMERKGFLKEGIGYEVSEGRWRFAEKIKERYGFHRVRNVNKNFLEDEPLKNKFDIVIMVDIVFQLIAPLYDSAQHDTLCWIYQSLKEKGKLFMELEDFTSISKELHMKDKIKTWEAFHKSDAFQYMLNEITADENGNLIWKKKFLKRNENVEDNMVNVIRPYEKDEILTELNDAGFKVSVYPYCEGERLYWRIVAEK